MVTFWTYAGESSTNLIVNKYLKPFFLEKHIDIVNRVTLQSFWLICIGKICIEYSDVTNYNCNRRGLLTIKGNPAFRQVSKRGYW